MLFDMIYCLRSQHCVDLCVGGLLLFLAGLQQVEAAAAAEEMANLNWKPFIYGGMASIVAEFGTLMHHDTQPLIITQTGQVIYGCDYFLKCKSHFKTEKLTPWGKFFSITQCTKEGWCIQIKPSRFRCNCCTVLQLQMLKKQFHASFM